MIQLTSINIKEQWGIVQTRYHISRSNIIIFERIISTGCVLCVLNHFVSMEEHYIIWSIHLKKAYHVKPCCILWCRHVIIPGTISMTNSKVRIKNINRSWIQWRVKNFQKVFHPVQMYMSKIGVMNCHLSLSIQSRWLVQSMCQTVT